MSPSTPETDQLRVTRRRAAALLGGGVALGLARPARAAARIARGPYLQLATPTGMTLLWRSEAPVPAATVDFRPIGPVAGLATPTASSSSAPGQSGGWTTVTSGSRGLDHAIALAGLRPHTLYEYRVRHDGQTAYEGGSFRTLPDPDAEDLDFVHYADNQTGHQPHASVVRRIMLEPRPPALLIHGGDQCENGSRPEQWDQWFQIERDLLARVAVFPCLGNHEENSPLFFENFRLPANGTGQGQGRWYSFDAGPAHFVALDVPYSDTEPGSPQWRWLDQDLMRTNRKWKFVYFHYPPYNASPHHRSNLRLRAALEPVFLRHKVSAVFNGHGHLYERAYGASATSDGPPLLWIVSGGGGGVPQPAGREAFTQYTEVTYHFLRVSIRGDNLSTAGVRPDGTEFDRFEARLNEDGRLTPVTESAAVTGRIVVQQPSAITFATSPRGGILALYQAALSLAAPLGLSVALPGRRRPVVPVPSGPVHQPRPRLEDPHSDWRGLPVMGIAVGAVLLLLLALLPTAPLQWLIGYDLYTITLTLHAALGTAMLITASTAATMGYRLAIRHAPSQAWIIGTVWATAALAAVSVLLGDALYAQYVKSGGPMEQVVRKAAEAHTILFEFKARVGLLPLPLATAAGFIAWWYRGDLRRDRHLAEMIAVLLLLLVVFVLAPYGLGTAVTRVRGIA